MRETGLRSPLEKLAIPHQFQPRLTLYEAFVAVTAATTRILLGCLIAALWGVRIWSAGASNHSTLWKSLSILALAGGMVVSLAILMFAVRALVRRLSKTS